MSEVEKLCDQIAIMHRGRILDTGTLKELRDKHEQPDFEELFFGLLSNHEQQETSDWNAEYELDTAIETVGVEK